MNRSTDFIPFALPSLDRREEEAVLRVLRSGWLTTGQETLAFEEEFARAAGVPFAAGVNSATAGLHLVLEALAIPPDSLVITTPYTFVATAEVIRYRRAHPLFVDINDDFNMDTEKVLRILKDPALARRVSAILPVHLGGRACDPEALSRAGEAAGIPLVEDAAHGFPAAQGGRLLGTFGAAGVYSFYATKTMTTGEGGMVVSRDEELMKKIRLLRLHGIDRDVWTRSRGGVSWEYDVAEVGFKYNLTDIAAALGRVQLNKAQDFLAERRRIARFYRDNLGDVEGLILPRDCPEHSWHLFIIRLNRPGLDRDGFIEKMAEAGIGCSVHYKPLHLFSYYRRTYGLKPQDLPRAAEFFHQAVSLPIYPGLGEEALHRITAEVRRLVQG
ncbi:MAG: DegT/DnrJ/EryC1/StrS aminotransferase family protein [Spirochaetales bacterium]|jgi:dTDP-4-amino-4,6-dideoxygalactose transaminase|nr:DegT/DnrJ/EryC1/StrS aminotransferase family protein [Spirochaetales bacterium]